MQGFASHRWGTGITNSRMILDGLKITDLFDAIIDGAKVSRAKPDPEVFLAGARELGLPPAECVVFEDAARESTRRSIFRIKNMKTVQSRRLSNR